MDSDNFSLLTSRWRQMVILASKYGCKAISKELSQYWPRYITLAVTGSAALATPAEALKFNFTYAPGVSLETVQSVQNAGSYWENILKDPVTVNINFGFEALPQGALGGAKPGMIKVNYRDYLNTLGQDILSTEDISILQSQLKSTNDQSVLTNYLNGEIDRQKLQFKDTKTFDVLLDGNIVASGSSQVEGGILDNNGNGNNQKIWLTRANAKALNLLKANDAKLDGNIVMSSLVKWDFNSNDGIDSDAYDFQTVLRHEIGHILGFVSGADAMDFLNMSSNGALLNDKDLTYLSPMNTVMYSQQSAGLKTFDLRSSVEKYMSIDGGVTMILDANGNPVLFASGAGNDGYQTSHWKDSLTSPLGIMNPSLSQGQSISASNLDLQLLDVIGWDRVSRSEKLMTETGLDWNAFQQALETRRQSVVQLNAAVWASYNPTDVYGIAGDLDVQLKGYYRDIDPKIEAILVKLKSDLEREKDVNKHQQLRNNAMTAIWNLVKTQDEQLKRFTDEVRNVNSNVRGWLDKKVSDLSLLLQNANSVQITKLSKLLAEASPEQRAIWEAKLSEALALFLDHPEKALAEINKSNSFNSPMGWGDGGWWGGWWSTGIEESNNDPNFFNYSTANYLPTNQNDSQSVPEPSFVFGLVTLGILGGVSCKKK